MCFHPKKYTFAAVAFIVMLKVMKEFHHSMIKQIRIVHLKNDGFAVFQVG